MTEFEEAKAVADPEVEVSGTRPPEKRKIKLKMRPTPLIAILGLFVQQQQQQQWPPSTVEVADVAWRGFGKLRGSSTMDSLAQD